MRIAVVSERLGERGAGLAALRLGRSLESSGHVIACFAANDLDSEIRKGARAGVDIVFFASWKDRYLELRRAEITPDPRRRIDLVALAHEGYELARDNLADELERFRPDVVHVHNVAAVLRHTDVLRLAERWPLVWTAHDQFPFRLLHNEWHDDEGGHWVWERSAGRWPSKAGLDAIARLRPRWSWITPSSWLEEVARATFPHMTIRTIPNLVPGHGRPRDTFDSLASALGVDFIGVASIVDTEYRLKNFNGACEALLEARALLSHRIDDWRVGLVVTTEEAMGLSGMGIFTIADLHAHGFIDENRLLSPAEFYDLISASDFVFVPSFVENLPNVAIEALEAGVPAVVTGQGGAGDVVGDAEGGILVDPADTSGMGRAIADLLADSDRRRRIAASGKQRWAERFTPDSIIEDHMKAYEDAIDTFAQRSVNP